MNAVAADRTCEAGFTLLELLIGLSLLSLLTLALYGSIHTGTRIWEATEEGAANADTVRAAQQQVSDTISAAYPKYETPDPTHSEIAFQGTPVSVRVLAADPDIRGEMAETTIASRETALGGELVLSRKPELSASAQNRSQVLLSGLAAVQFSYYGRENPDDPPAWHDQWQGKARPPELVRIRAGFLNRRVAWPDLIVRPRIEADVGCTFDALTKFCQGR